MAQDDIELNIGVNFDENEFSNAFAKTLDNLQTQTKQYVAGALDEMKGAASKIWGQLPYYSMHDTGSGNANATKAFLASLAKDLQGLDTNSAEFQSAMMNAAYKSSIPDAMQRYHQMLSQGFMRQADLTHPDTVLGKTIETDYALMSQPWSRDFIRMGPPGNLKEEALRQLSKGELYNKAKELGLKGLSGANKDELIGAIQQKVNSPGAYVDFGGMREYAVEAGLGKWIDPEKEHTADNFELINDELEKIEETSDKTERNFLDWHDTLKGVLGTLGAIGGAVGLVAKINAVAEKTTLSAASAIDKRRGFVGMSALDELRTKVASRAVGMGEDAVSNEIYSMSANIEQYKLFGQGDALPPALLGIFDNLMSSDDPYKVYTEALDEIYGNLQNADEPTKRRWLMLLNKAGLGSASNIIGQFLSNPDYAKTYKTPSALFSLTSNPYYGAYEQAEQLAPALAKINESIKASYAQLALDWENTFGVEFKDWWDKFLKNLVVPGAVKVEEFLSDPKGSINNAKVNYGFLINWEQAKTDLEKATTKRKLASMDKNTGVWSKAAEDAVLYDDSVYWLNFKSPTDMLKYKTGRKAVEKLNNAVSGKITPRDFIAGLEALADTANYKEGALDNLKTSTRRAKASETLEWLKDSGLYDILHSDVNNPNGFSKAVMKVMMEHMMAPSSSDATLTQFTQNMYTQIPEVQEIIKTFLTANKDYLYDEKHRDQLLDVQIHLKNQYGVDIPIEVDGKTLRYTDGSTVDRS